MNINLREGYRKDIDGLRGVAILSVLFFHINNSFLPGGFVGVDIFFVISGFLITSIIAKSIREQRFSFIHFYIKRIRRIFPALFVVLLISFVVGFLILTIDDFAFYAKTLRYSMLQVSNIFFMKRAGYFDPGIENNLLLHTWSLGVEEQFYVIYPLILFALIKYTNSSKVILYWLGALLVASFIISEYYIDNDHRVAFFSLQSRFWEFLCGAIIAINTKKLTGRANNAVGMAGLALIVASVFISSKNYFPGFGALMPVIGSAMVIFSSHEKSTISYKILSNKFLLFIGVISYSLYLWHWLIIAAYKDFMEVNNINIIGASVITILSVALSYLSWKYIENPFRKKKSLSDEVLFTLKIPKFVKIKFYTPFLVSLLVIAPLLNIAFDIKSDYKKRYGVKWSNLRMSEPSKDGELKKQLNNFTNKNCGLKGFNLGFCQGRVDDNFEVLLIGDSHAEHYANAVDVWAKKRGLSVFMVAKGGCPLLSGLSDEKSDPFCDNINIDINRALKTIKTIKYVFIASKWNMYGADKNSLMKDEKGEKLSLAETRISFEQQFDDLLKKVSDMNLNVIVLTQVPKMHPVAKKYNDKINLPLTKIINPYDKNKNYNLIDLQEYLDMTAYNNQAIRKIASKYKNVSIFDPIDHMCDDKFCYSIREGNVLYLNDGHLNILGGRYLGERL